DAAGAHAGDHRFGERHLGPAAAGHPRGASRLRPDARTAHRRRRRALRSHRTTPGDGSACPRVSGVLMRLTHGRITLELHQLAQASGPTVLLLHALGGSSADWSAPSGAALGEPTATWPGSIYALDFCGHGRSQRLTGGGYYPELLLGDADVA